MAEKGGGEIWRGKMAGKDDRKGGGEKDSGERWRRNIKKFDQKKNIKEQNPV